MSLGGARPLRTTRLAAAIGAALLALAVALGIWTVWDARWQARADAVRTLQNLAHTLAENIERYDTAIRDAIAGLQLPGLADANPEIRHAALFTSMSRARYMASLLVLNERGDIAYDSDRTLPRQGNFADRDFFQKQRERADLGLTVGRPVLGRLSGRPVIGLSRRISVPDGGFGGIALGAIQLAYFQDLFARLALGDGGLVALSRDDGIVLARKPYAADLIGRDIGASPLYQRSLRARDGVVEGPGVLDGIERLYVAQHVGTFPLVITVGFSEDEIFAPWRRKAIATAATLAAVCGLALALALALRRELGRRARAEAELRTYFADLVDGIVVLCAQPDGHFTYAELNRAAKQLLGTTSEGLQGKRPAQLWPPPRAEAVEARPRECAANGRPVSYAETIVLPGGGRRELLVALTPVRGEAGCVEKVIQSLRDVTERSRLEEMLRHGQKLEAIGRIAAGVAHDFNNILQGVTGGLELALDGVPEDTQAHRFAHAALASAKRGSYLTHHLLSYARKQVLRPRAVALAPFLAEMRALLSRTLGPHIAVELQVDEGTPPVHADPSLLQTALLNLAVNAMHAMPQGGTLSLRARRAGIGGAGAVITVTDTSTGMDDATLA